MFIKFNITDKQNWKAFVIHYNNLSTILYSRSTEICSLGGSITHQRFYLVKVLTYIKAESELRISLKKVVCATKQQSGRIISQIEIIFKEDGTVVWGIKTMWSWQQSLSMLSVKYQFGNHERQSIHWVMEPFYHGCWGKTMCGTARKP